MLFCVSIGVCAVWKKAGIIAVDHVVDVVLCEQLGQEVGSQIIWDSCKRMQISWVLSLQSGFTCAAGASRICLVPSSAGDLCSTSVA